MKKIRLVIFIVFLMCCVGVGAETFHDFDVHLVLEPKIENTIKKFNRRLEQEGILKKYKFQPFLNQGDCVHITLYLTSYNTKNEAKIENIVEEIASTTKPFKVSVSRISVAGGGFIMLWFENSEQLDQLCQLTIDKLAPLRNKNSEIPAWAKSIPAKLESFKKYGTPNAGSQFVPHISIAAKAFSDSNKEKQFMYDINKVINSFKLNKVQANAIGLGVGRADSNGQMKIDKVFLFMNR